MAAAQIMDDRAKLILYQAFVEGELHAPRSLLPEVHRLYFAPQYIQVSAERVNKLARAVKLRSA